VQTEADGQATLFRKLFCVSCELGVGRMLHCVPFQRSASVPSGFPELSAAPPTPMQVNAVVQDTLNSPLCGEPAGFGVGKSVHWLPFQPSARVPLGLPLLAVKKPTAMQAETVGHETPARKPPPPEGFGVGWMLHSAPFQRSASVPVGIPELSNAAPTAMHAEADEHDTAARKLPGAPARLGVGRMPQRAPFQRSASVPVGTPELSVEAPTAMHAEPAVHATPVRRLPYVPAGLGVGSIFHAAPFQRSARVPVGLRNGSASLPTALQDDDDVHAAAFRTLLWAPEGPGVDWTLHSVPFHRSASV
jgi:hypothetical protein